jgi:DNA-binding XRE family transcriptional regulator
MPLDQGYLAQNVRRLAGMHLASMEALASYVAVSRQTMQSIVAHEPHNRSLPRADTAIKIAEAFGVSLNALYSDPIECLREALENFEEAPIREAVDPPRVTLADVKRVADEAGVPVKVHYLPKGRKRRQ